MPDYTRNKLILGVPGQAIDVPAGYPQTGMPPMPSGLTTLNFTTSAAQTVLLPPPAAVYNLWVRVDVANLAAETLGIKSTQDSTNYPDVPTLLTMSTGQQANSGTCTNGSFLLAPGQHITGLQFTKSSATDRAFVAVSWGGVPSL